jgi:serine phosphatase RsbU (regulator of sigma subunit)
VKRRIQEWLIGVRTAYPSATSPYWRALPIRRMGKLICGTFFTAVIIGFTADLLQLDADSLASGFFWPIFIGGAMASVFLARIRAPRLVLPLLLLACAIGWLAVRHAYNATPLQVPGAVKKRVIFDCVGIYLSAAISFRLLLSFVSTEGLQSVRMQTELSLAHGIQATLVPTISFQNASFEVHGKSIPSTEMGGDLIDLMESDGGLVAYVADISGHGLAAGQLMGMLKTAMRVSFEFRRPLLAMLECVDRVLPVVKEPEVFATLAIVSFSGSGFVEYALAGHVPILHYRDGSRDTIRLSMQQYPLGLFPGGGYESARTTYAKGDLFLIVSDGMTEVFNEKDEEFGLTGLQQVLTKHAGESLPELCSLIMAEAMRHGPQQDDQSVLLVRVRG